MAGFDNDVIFAENVDFSGTSPVSGQINQDGELLVGSSVAPYIRSHVPAGSSGVSITTGQGTIDFSLSNVPNSALQNSSIDLPNGTNISVSGSPVSLGGSAIVSVSGPPSATSLTNHGVVIGQGTSAMTATATGSSGQVLQSGGASSDPSYSTATYPSTATGTGSILRADGTNWAATTATYPATTTINQVLYSSSANTVTGLATANNGTLVTSNTGVPSILAGPGVSGKVLQSNAAAAPSYSTPTYPSASGTSGKVLISDGTNNVYSTPTFPNSATSTGTILRADGTNWVATTATYPTTTTANQIVYSSSANVVGGLASANNSVLVTDGSGVPSLGTSLSNNFTYTTSTAGATRSVTVSNTDNTNAASTALVQTTTGGASSGDPIHTFTVTGATSWSTGIDNSASDAFVIAASTALGTTNVLSMATGGAASFVLGDLDVTRSNNGGAVLSTISNTSNTASSTARQQVTVAGTSAGDAFSTYTVSGTTNWSVGVDNSVANDPFVVSASTALGTTDVLSMTTAGAASFVLGNLDVTRSSSGGTVTSTVSNTSNTASSNALQQVTVAGTSSGDAFTTYTVSGTTNWSQGVDNSDSDALVIAASTTLGTTNVWRASTAGEVTMPLQPAFLAYLASSDLNVTGDASNFKYGSVTALTEIFDVNSDFNTNGTFTAPINGKYHLNMCVYIGGVLSTHTLGYCQIVTSNRNFTSNWCAPSKVFAVSTNMQLFGSAFADMEAADTAEFQIQVNNGTKVVDALIGTNTQMENYLEGYLVC